LAKAGIERLQKEKRLVSSKIVGEVGMEIRALDLLGALSLMSDMALGFSAGHGVRATYIGMRIGQELRLPNDELADLFYAALLTDAGCTAWASQSAAAFLGDDMEARRELVFFGDPTDPREMLKWLVRYMAAGERISVRVKRIVDFAIHGRQFMIEGMQNTSDVAARFACRLDRSARVQEALRYAFEHWDGSGLRGQRGETVPLISRITYAAIFLEVFHGVKGRAAAIDLARSRRGIHLDPAVVDAFIELANDDEFWQSLESDGIWSLVRAMEPESPFQYFSVARLDEAAQAFGDFADLKSFYTAGHSRRVAGLSESITTILRLSAEMAITVRRAGLLHDVGLVAIPSFVLHKPPERLSEAEWEMMRLHPYHGERILSRVPAFLPVSPVVAAHHERPDGKGYFRGLSEDEMPVGARILAVADRFDELTHKGPEREPLSPEAALAVMSRGESTEFCTDALAALRESVTGEPGKQRDAKGAPLAPTRGELRHSWPAGLTDREIEVIRILATGASRRDIADFLSVSEHTVRHHLEHIYAKIDVRTRVEATLFAIEHALLS
jgi:HD-GYP domain-containing protein (c-di-GMP phosphodiesterase class II)/DNA-binding CsgD family transcriptional regulator